MTLMNPLDVLRDSLRFTQRNLGAIVQLCLPLVILEALLQQGARPHARPGCLPRAYSVVVGLLVYPLYTGALILFLDARTRGESPRTKDVWAMALTLWPRFALLTAMSTLLILLGLSLYFLPGLWLMVVLAFAEYLLVLRGMPALAAMKESLRLTAAFLANPGVPAVRNDATVAAQRRQHGGVSRARAVAGRADRQRAQLPAAVYQCGAVPFIYADRWRRDVR